MSKDLLPPWWMIVTTWAGNLCHESSDMYRKVMSLEERDEWPKVSRIDDEICKQIRQSEFAESSAES
jgi:hypothetical protein